MIRPATHEDIPRLVAMGEQFIADSEYWRFVACDPERMGITCAWLINNETNALLVDADNERIAGMIGLVTYTHPVSGAMVATELFWWVDPEARDGRRGLRLLRAAEAWAKAAGAACIQMVAPSERIEQLYARLRYSRVEVTYQRSL
jgi:GNAT superfamily N-acetyltransferase